MTRRTTAFVFALATLALSATGCLPDKPVTWERVRSDIAKEFPHARSIGTEELAGRLVEKSPAPFVLLDVRAREEYAVSHIPGAIWGGTPEAREAALAKAGPKTPVIVYCSVGWRSAKVVTELQSADTRRPAYNLDGSIFKWANEGRPLVDSAGKPTEIVHPYDRRWGVLLDKSRHPRP